jgi:peptidyl-prolyl cis-trans isomerase SurA
MRISIQVNMVFAKIARTSCVMALALAVGVAPVTAQVVTDSDTPAAGLDLPANLQIFGKVDPNVRKPTAIVNDVVITGTDVDQRVALIAGLNNIKLTDEDRNRLKLQVLRQLIDEVLEIQEAKSQDVSVDAQQIDQSFARVSRNFNRSPDDMRTYLRSIGSSERSLRRQIEGELAWNRLLQRKVTPFVNVSDDEVQGILKRIEASKGTDEYHLSEIYLSATPDRAQQVASQLQGMVQQMRQGQPFGYFARTYSEASTRAVDGDLGWIRLQMLPESMATAAQQMQVGQIAGPVEVPGGFSLMYLVDKRQVLTADPRDAKLNLRQITLKFAPNITQAQASAQVASFAKATQAMQGCGDVTKTASSLGAEVVDNASLKVRDLPGQLQDIILKLQIGQATPPFGGLQEGVRVLVLCGRDDPQTASLPSAEQIQSQLEDQRVNLRGQRMLRDLRRDALVEYR